MHSLSKHTTFLVPYCLRSLLFNIPILTKCSLSPSSQWVQPRPSFSPRCTHTSVSPSQLTVVCRSTHMLHQPHNRDGSYSSHALFSYYSSSEEWMEFTHPTVITKQKAQQEIARVCLIYIYLSNACLEIHAWQVRPSTGPRSSVNSFPMVKSMLKFLKVVSVRIFMAPVSGLWVISLVGFSRHTIFLKAKLRSEMKEKRKSLQCFCCQEGVLSLGVNSHWETRVTERTSWGFHHSNVLLQIRMAHIIISVCED